MQEVGSHTISGRRQRANLVGESLSPQEATPPSAAAIRAAYKHVRGPVKGEVFAGKLIVVGVLTAGGIALTLQHVWWMRVIGVIVLGLMYAHAAELQHQALHNIGFRRATANTVSGIVTGLPMLISFSAYRATHLRHHRYLGTPLNREFFDYRDQYGTGEHGSRLSAAVTWAYRFSMAGHYAQFAVSLCRALTGRDFEGETATTSRRIRRDYFIMLAAVSALVALSFATRQPIVLWVWLIPLLLVAGPVHALIELPEHFRCATLDENIFANTRTIRSNWLMSWYTNGNNFHVEHHLMPNLPIERLGLLHEEVIDQLQHFNATYREYYSKLIRNK